jgi:hypothetical protein
MKNMNFWSNYIVDCNIINKLTIKYSLDLFWNSIMNDLPVDNSVHIFLKVRFSDGTLASISKMQTVNKSMFKELLDTFKFFSDHKAENYSSKTITKFIFQYHIIILENSQSIKSKLSKKSTSKTVEKTPTFYFGGYQW